MKIYRDYETLSVADIQSVGAVKYAQHPSTDIFCLGLLMVDDDGTQNKAIWVNPCFVHMLPAGHGLPLINTEQLRTLHMCADGAIMYESHNDGFERAIDTYVMEPRYGVPTMPLEYRSCSAAQAAANALPRSLGQLSAVLGLEAAGKAKDKIGHDLMLRMCKPLPMSPARWDQLHRRFSSYEHYRTAADIYKNAKTNKSRAYAAYLANNWDALKKDGYDPNDFLFWHHDEYPEDLVNLCNYCLQDVVSEAACSEAMPALSDDERRVWLLDQIINSRGVCIDTESALAAMDMVTMYKDHMERQLSHITGGTLTAVTQHQRLNEWCANNCVDLPNTSKATIEFFLQNPKLPEKVRQVLQIRAACGQTSVSKYDAMVRAASDTDSRVRDVFMYCGAGTGRWTANLLQLHNMPRGTIKLDSDEAIEAAFDAMRIGWQEAEVVFGDVMGLAASTVRGCIVAGPGKDFIVSDFASIEARVLPWLAAEKRPLQVFSEGLDTYKVAAQGIFGRDYDDITAEQRQVGKCSELALGYGGGIGAYASMARNYGINLETLPGIVLPGATEAELNWARRMAERYLENLEKWIKLNEEQNKGTATFLDRMSVGAAMACDVIKQRWRANRPGAVALWAALEAAAYNAIQNPGVVFSAGPQLKLAVMDKYLLMKLPSGRCLRYFKPEVRTSSREDFGGPYALTYMRTVDGKWGRAETYGGKLCENADQAVSNDLLRHAMFNVEAAGYPIVMHVHDEIVAEVDEGFGSVEELNACMVDAPAWAAGLPMGAEGWRGKRYRKG